MEFFNDHSLSPAMDFLGKLRDKGTALAKSASAAAQAAAAGILDSPGGGVGGGPGGSASSPASGAGAAAAVVAGDSLSERDELAELVRRLRGKLKTVDSRYAALKAERAATLEFLLAKQLLPSPEGGEEERAAAFPVGCLTPELLEKSWATMAAGGASATAAAPAPAPAPPAAADAGEAARLLGIPRALVVHRMDIGDLPCRRIGRNRRATLQDVLALKARLDAQRAALQALDRRAHV